MKKLYKIQLFILFSLFISTIIRSQCNAGFVLTQNAGGNVTFTSTSTGTTPSTYYQWNYGDATNANGSGLTNMSHTYPTNGNYTITLTITDFSVCTSTYTQAISVTNSPCTVAINSSFTFTNTTAGNVNFTSTSTGTTVTSTYLWNFGDGNTSTTMNPSHTYSSNANFLVNLSVTDGTCSDSTWGNVTVTNAPCLLVPSFTYSNTSSGQFYFVSTSTGTSSSTSYLWDFGDGSPFGSGNPIYHTYLSNGTYTVNLMVNNTFTASSTCSASVSQTILVSTSTCSTPVNASFTYTNTGLGNVNFTSTSTNTLASSTYTWDFGDGNTSGIMNPSHTYTYNGNFGVKLWVSNSVACTDTAYQYIPITTLPCTLTPSFTFTNTSSGQIYFVSTSTGTSSSTSYTWNFGDGNFGYTNPIYHNYATNGTYTVTLMLNNTFTASSTCSASVSQTILVTTSACTTAVNASFTSTNSGGGNVNFTSTSTGTTASSTYMWNFGDGNTSTVMNPSNTYTVNGNFNVYLQVTDGTCSDSVWGNVMISTLPCSITPSFTFSNTSSGQLYFTSTSTGVSPGASYYWDFGDMSYGFTNPIYHTYASNGSYSVTLVVTNNSPTISACSASVTIPVSVTTGSCIANPSFYLAKSTSTTTNLWFAYPTYPANITNAFWDWGDATSSTGLYPSHIYASTGWYNICLTVTVNCVATGSMCVLSNIFRMQAGADAAGIAQINVVNTAVSVQELNKNNAGFTIYPNPNNGVFSLALDPSYNNETSSVVLYNMLGEVIYTAKYERNEGLIKEIDLSNISSGAYFMQLSTAKGNFSKKLIINK